MSLAVFALVAFATLVTTFISGILGMAGGMILMGVLIALLPVATATMLQGITQFASNGWRGWMLRSSIDWRVFRGYALGALASLAVFAAVQLAVSKPVALVMLGLMPFIGLALPEKLKLNVERRGHPPACGAVCTGLSLVTGVSGPILDVFFVCSKMGRHAVVATKALSQSVTHLLKVAYFGGRLAASRGDVPLHRGRAYGRPGILRHEPVAPGAGEDGRLVVSRLDALDDDGGGHRAPRLRGPPHRPLVPSEHGGRPSLTSRSGPSD